MRVAILGAGISGVTTAFFLARAGHEVSVVEREPGPALGASHRNGGVAGGTQVEPWAKPGIPRKLVGWVGRDDAPILIPVSRLWGMIAWGARFLRSCRAKDFDRALRINVRLTLHSRAMFDVVRSEARISPADYDLCTRGAAKVFLTTDGYAAALATAEKLRAAGCRVEEIAPRELADREPCLEEAAPGLAGALFYPDEEIGDCAKFCAVLERHCRSMGVRFLYGVEARRLVLKAGRAAALETSAGGIEAQAFVVALASFASPFLRQLGLRVPVLPVKGVSVSIPAEHWPRAVRGGVMDHSRLFGIMRIGERLRITGLAEFAGYDSSVSMRRCKALIDAVLSLMPGFAACLANARPHYWSGLRGNTPDSSPILGLTPVPGLYLNVGHGSQGWSTSCGAADLVSRVVCGETAAVGEDLGLQRFNGRA